MSDDYELFGQDLEEASQDLSSYAENHAQCPAPLPSLQPATSGPAATCGKTVLSWVPGALALDMGASQACASCPGHSCSSRSQLPEQRLATESITGPTALSTPACSAASGPVGPASSKQGEGPPNLSLLSQSAGPLPRKIQLVQGHPEPQKTKEEGFETEGDRRHP